MARSFDWERSNRQQKAGPKHRRGRQGGPMPKAAPISKINFPPTEQQRSTIRAIAARHKLEASDPECIRTRREASVEIRRLLFLAKFENGSIPDGPVSYGRRSGHTLLHGKETYRITKL